MTDMYKPKRSSVGLVSITSYLLLMRPSPILNMRTIRDDTKAGLISPGLGKPCHTRLRKLSPEKKIIKVVSD